MGLWDKIRGWIGEEEDPDVEETEETAGGDDTIDFVTRTSSDAEEPAKRSNKVVNIHATAQLAVVLVKPERFDDASAVADHLNAKRTVVLNLESANKDVARRILDFLSGVAYANDGQIKKVANCTFIITPYNVGLMGDLLDELENNGLYF
jgi:cell division inhibitor SepF